MSVRNLTEYLEASARSWPDRPAVVDPDGSSLSYRALHEQSDALAAFLASRGVIPGDRVGVVLPKSTDAVVSLFGIMKAGAAYVPVDFTAPADRGRRILSDCQVRAAIVDERTLDMLPEYELAVTVVRATAESGLTARHEAVPFEQAVKGAPPAATNPAGPADLAYILYTSGSTGMPKGVMLTHENAIGFVDWCSSVFEPGPDDRFSSHAPFHFDLSVLDIYVAIKHGATLFLISEDLGKNPKELAHFIAAHRLTIWYSTPSILTLLVQFGNLPAHDMSSLRIVLFAGEVFPVKHLREVKRHWPAPVYYNLYGPTETNVCTFARIPRSCRTTGTRRTQSGSCAPIATVWCWTMRGGRWRRGKRGFSISAVPPCSPGTGTARRKTPRCSWTAPARAGTTPGTSSVGEKTTAMSTWAEGSNGQAARLPD